MLDLYKQKIIGLIEPHSKVLDLGCGDGDLLQLLIRKKNVKGYGIDFDFQNILACTKRGISIFQGDVNEGLREFPDRSFDFVILSQTLQQVQKPEFVISESLRVGKKVIVTFPNFGYYRLRFQFFWGVTPKSKELPDEWYNTPNIRILTIKDFRRFCKEKHIRVLDEVPLFHNGFSTLLPRFLSNLFSTAGMFVIQHV